MGGVRLWTCRGFGGRRACRSRLGQVFLVCRVFRVEYISGAGNQQHQGDRKDRGEGISTPVFRSGRARPRRSVGWRRGRKGGFQGRQRLPRQIQALLFPRHQGRRPERARRSRAAAGRGRVHPIGRPGAVGIPGTRGLCGGRLGIRRGGRCGRVPVARNWVAVDIEQLWLVIRGVFAGGAGGFRI